MIFAFEKGWMVFYEHLKIWPRMLQLVGQSKGLGAVIAPAECGGFLMKDYQWYAIAVYAGIFLLGWLFRGGMEDCDEENSPTAKI